MGNGKNKPDETGKKKAPGKNVYRVGRHMVVDECGHVWPDDDDGENRKAGRQVECVLSAKQAERYGSDLIKVRAVETADDKQITEDDIVTK